MTTKIQQPEALDPSRLYTQEQYKNWKRQMAAYHDAINVEQEQKRKKEEAALAKANALLTDEEYDHMAQKRHAELKAKQAARAAEELAKKDADDAYLASLPDIAEVSERSEHLFLLKLQHWMSQGYRVDENSIVGFTPGFYCVRLNKSPAKDAK